MVYNKVQSIILKNQKFLLSDIKSSNKIRFFISVWSTPQSAYNKRLRRIGFYNKSKVLDFGAGFGQWMVQMSKLNKEVYVIEKDLEKVKVLKKIIKLLNLSNVVVLDHLSKNKIVFDAIFLYSVIYFTNWRKKLIELIKLLKKNGLIYINSNDLGWYLYNFFKKHNNSKDFNSKDMSIDTFYNTINNTTQNSKYKQLITPKKSIIEILKKNNFNKIQSGGDGHCGSKAVKTRSFFLKEFKNVTAVYEILAKK